LPKENPTSKDCDDMMLKFPSGKTIEIEEDLVEFFKKQDEDYRVCTSCLGAELLPVSVKSAKLSDHKIRIGKIILYISKIQANYLRKIDKSMLRPSDMVELKKILEKK
jgi:hypothetical protein